MSDNISRLIDDSDLLLIFKTKLLEVGYFSNPYYDSKNYQIIKSYKMKVDENFPKLLRSNVSCDVLGASYEINIEKIPKLIPGVIFNQKNATSLENQLEGLTLCGVSGSVESVKCNTGGKRTRKNKSRKFRK
jgi:hypothetical protein